ncbi:MAG: M23 family metallopeptidase [Alphaproteobacteria bacterium]
MALGLAACGPVTAPVTGAYGPSTSRAPAAPQPGPATNPSSANPPSANPAPTGGPGTIKVEPLPAPHTDGALPRPIEKPVADGAASREHVVQPGETVYSIARRYNVTAADLMRANAIPPAFTIKVGQHLALPDGASAATDVARSDAPRPETQAATQAPAASPAPSGGAAPAGHGTAASAPAPAEPAETSHSPALPELAYAPPIASRGDTQNPEHAAAPATQPASLTPPQRSGQGFQWPVRGRVISDYGSKGHGLRNDGINIAAPRGTPVLAADNGVVAYTGNELKGFGNLILIRHANGWVTAYAHNDALLVSKGANVKRGQPIARVGATGNVREPQLHFEMRRARVAVDPLPHLEGESGRAEQPQAFNRGVSRAGPPDPG